jgi:hypothetical protein
MGTILYNTVMRQVAHRLDALVSDQSSDMESNYTANPLTMANLNDPVWSLHVIGDAMLMTQFQTIQAICDTDHHPFRVDYLRPSSFLINGALLPTSIGAVPIIGAVWGEVRDASDEKICTPRNIRVILRRIDNPGGIHAANSDYHYCLEGGRIYHTRPSVLVSAACFDSAAEETAVYAAAGTIKIRDVLAPLLVWGSIGVLAGAENAAMPQSAGLYGAAFQAGLQNLRGGATWIDPTAGPAPPVVPQQLQKTGAPA